MKLLLAALFSIFTFSILSAQTTISGTEDDGTEHHEVTGPFKEGSQDNPFRMSIRVAATVPHAMSNRAFRRSFTGIYNVSGGYYFQVFRGFQAGLQFEHSLWKTADNKIAGINTYAQSFHGGIRVGYDRIIGVNAVAFVGVSFLQGMMKYYGLSFVTAPDPAILKTKYNYGQISTDVGAFFYTEGNFAIGVHLGADFSTYSFDPYKLYLNQHKAYIASDLNGKFAQFNCGFNAVYSFASSKPKAQ